MMPSESVAFILVHYNRSRLFIQR